MNSTMMNETTDALANLATFLNMHNGAVMKIVAIAMTKDLCTNIESFGNANSQAITFVKVSPTIML